MNKLFNKKNPSLMKLRMAAPPLGPSEAGCGGPPRANPAGRASGGGYEVKNNH
jgi:hypothetical protein